ncbi:MAG: acylphosphatase [Thermoplasmata archaeon]|nr:acylphosphatase [Thermoplasmata archaeon]
MAKARAHAIFRGRVQGVFFRANTERKAREVGVVGWVRNLADGTVEAVFEGDRDAIQEAIEWCRDSQPYAKVSSVQVSWDDPTDSYTSFEVRR